MLAVMAGLMLVGASAVFAVGGVVPDGQGTNWSYGNVYGQGSYSLRNFSTFEIDGAGITNIVSDGIVSLDAAKLQAGTVMPAVDGSAITNLPAATSMDAANLIVGSTASAIDGNAITNLNASNLAAGGVLPALDGSALTNVTANAPGDMLSTNDVAQEKAGKLTLNGGLEVGGLLTLKLGDVKTIASDAAVAADAANVKVVGDAAPVTATIADGATEGQVLTIRGTSDTDTVTLTNSAVVPTFKLGLRDVISFQWDGSQWVEVYRRDN